ncbi:type VII secretion-associated protein [Mycobacterium celatum]|uniref:Type VII secretion-associated protein n=1 Tax=Mycobacterium celatum TaxID=28045 RepID=A0A1X1RSB9_MYCCE|nr:type VII secretion-associated protein [Mycobacterium celatum]ORV14717.1 Type VII secretion-associated protein [Mycobacterium celatum]PIB79972.1 type VII secretion-associated protein [Mycobacterium celatum]
MIESGPGTVRQLCCGRTVSGDSGAAALEGIDDPVALVDERPVAVESLWRTVLQSLLCERAERAVVVHPSWWTQTRIATVAAAAQVLADKVELRPRAWLLARSSPLPTVVVEIAQRLVVVIGAVVRAEPRRGEPQRVAEAVARVVAGMTSNSAATVVIDAPCSVPGARVVATMIAERLPAGLAVRQVDDAGLQRLAASAVPGDEQAVDVVVRRPRRYRGSIVLVPLIAVALGFIAFSHHAPSESRDMPTTFLVEGRVAVQVPAEWTTERVIAGPGSARVQVTSPSDPQLAVHVTQSPVGPETLAVTAESLKRAIDAEPPGVFVDFNPAGVSAGRPAVTYREVRADHDIRWSVVLDPAVRIAIGCQNRRGDDDAIRDVCDMAVRSAHEVK